MTKILCEGVSPHLSPQRGYPLVSNRPVFTRLLSWFGGLTAPPTSVGFMARTAAVKCEWKPCSPKTSLVAHATDEFTHTDGEYGCKGHTHVLYEVSFNKDHCWETHWRGTGKAAKDLRDFSPFARTACGGATPRLKTSKTLAAFGSGMSRRESAREFRGIS